jgi:type 1 fimbria pilin
MQKFHGRSGLFKEQYQMRHLALFSGAALALIVPASVMADDTSHLVVTGVISPASCGVSLGGASEVQLGTIKVSDFVADQDLVLKEKDAALSITCEGAAAKFWLKASDGTTEGAYQPGISHYGLGFNEQGRKPNGYFTLSIDAASMATNNFVLKSTDGEAGQSWVYAGNDKVSFDHDGNAFAFATSESATEPAALSTLTVPLKIAAVLAKNPVVNEEVQLAGKATIEIYY